jgi:hypothetical protein
MTDEKMNSEEQDLEITEQDADGVAGGARLPLADKVVVEEPTQRIVL